MMTFHTLIDVQSLRALLADGRPMPNSATRAALVLLDCRFDLGNPAAARQAYSAGHIPGARYVDLNRDLAAPVTAHSGRHPLPDPAALARFFGSLGIGDDTQVVVYDDANGSFAARAWWLLRWLGHLAVAVLDGGFKAWAAAGGAVDAAQPERCTGRFTVRFKPGSVATSAEVLQALADPERLLVDARAAERFAGTAEPIDPVAGHVPGAVNHPFACNLGSDGHFLPPPELRRRWLERLAGILPGNAILMCGSGITACHNLLAMELAGLGGARLYAGSWSEWIRDPSRPVTPSARA
jgi:thiosulfate/3-mercaptopyruvate sulfurtransferase